MHLEYKNTMVRPLVFVYKVASEEGNKNYTKLYLDTEPLKKNSRPDWMKSARWKGMSRWKSCKERARRATSYEVNIAWNNDICPKNEAIFNVEWKKKCKKVLRI